jgi:hypothetical protein
MTATFGDFLRPAGEHIAAAVSIRDDLSVEATFGVIRQFGRLLSTLVRYLDDWPVPDEFEAAMAAESLSPGSRAGPAANPFHHRLWRHPGMPFVLGAGHHLAAGDSCPARRDRRVCAPAGAVDGAPGAS